MQFATPSQQRTIDHLPNHDNSTLLQFLYRGNWACQPKVDEVSPLKFVAESADYHIARIGKQFARSFVEDVG
jgi:hypothetical protein